MHASFSEILVVLLVAVLVIKPEHLPSAAQKLGKCLKWFRQTATKIKTEMYTSLDSNQPKEKVKNE